MTWRSSDLTDLHPDFRGIIPSLLNAAVSAGLDVRRQSGYRSNARQRQLYDVYLANQEKFLTGQGEQPLPAAPPGKSAHNFALCSREPAHVIRDAVQCPECGAATLPASLALDISLHDSKGNAIHCPNVPLPERPFEWQIWAGILDTFQDAVRDGGDFSGRRDVVHFESVHWNVMDHSFKKPT